MRDGWKRTRLGDLCTLTKGVTPTMKATPGKYPLVVTAADFLSSDEYQFEGEAVCVPLVSSTGHGHASLKRVHYASGRFAVANIITALQRQDDAPVDMKFLWLLLDHGRGEIIVPLMKGTANVSLSQGALAGAEIHLPPIDEQRRIVDLIGALDDTIAAAEKRRGGLDALESATRARAWSVGAPVRLQYLGRLMTGATPSTRDESLWSSPDVPFVTPGDLPWGGQAIDLSTVERRTSRAAADASTRRLDGPAVLQVCIGATVGKTAFVEGTSLFNQQINAVLGLGRQDARVLAALLASPQFQHALQSSAGSSTMPLVSKGTWGGLEVMWPAEEDRLRWCEVFDVLDAARRASRTELDRLRSLRSNLLTALLSGEHEIPESYDEVMEATA